jgi:hypothetical protein
MDPRNRVVASLPLEGLWRDDGHVISVDKLRSLKTEDVANLLRVGPVNFVVAEAGLPLRWIDSTDCYAFWKREVKGHLAEPDQKCTLDSFPDGYFYFAAEWRTKEKLPTIVVERHH